MKLQSDLEGRKVHTNRVEDDFRDAVIEENLKKKTYIFT